jgi:myo-inositol 2-dehydrogenase/D-chiro-inositol 1-dehydrogenase
VPVRIGFVGAGAIANHHFNTLQQIEDAQPVAFCDADKRRSEAAARRFEGRAYRDVRKMLEAETLDAIYVCLPPHAHKDAEILAAQKGCAVFVEKPVANNLRTAERIATAIEDGGVLSAVGYHFRYFDATQQLQKLLTPKNSPQVAMAHGYWLGGFPNRTWWKRMEQSGGQVVEQGTHLIDLARYLIGEITNVYARAAQREMYKLDEDINVPDVSALTVEFANGAIGTFQYSCLLGKMNDVGLTLLLREKTYELKQNTLTVRSAEETHTFTHSNNAMLQEDQAFIQAVATGKRTLIKSTYSDAIKTLRVTLAANQSAKSGKPVKL